MKAMLPLKPPPLLLSPQNASCPLCISQAARPNKKIRRPLLAISLRQPGCLILERPVGFAPLPRGRFAFIQDARKYTRGKELVAISLIAASQDGRRLIRASGEQSNAPRRGSLSHCRLVKPFEGLERQLLKALWCWARSEGPKFGSEHLFSGALATDEQSRSTCYLETFVHLWRQICCLPV